MVESSMQEGATPSLSRKWALLVALSRHEIKRKYKETIFGAIWAVVVPLVILAVYTVIFSEIFNAKWGGVPVAGKTDYAVLLFAGLIIYQIFAEAVNRAPSIILQNANFVKKVVFPLEVLPAVPLASSLYGAIASLISFGLFFMLSSFKMSWAMLMIPVLLLPVVMFTLGLSYWLAAIGVYLKDTDQFTTLLTRVLQYLTPVLYPTTVFPEKIANVMRLNPLAVQIEEVRNILVSGVWPRADAQIYSLLICSLVLVSGYAWFKRVSRGFADAL